MLKKIVVVAAALVVVAVAALAYLMGGPKNLYGLARYAIPRMSRGELRVGDRAPDAQVTSLDGRSTFQLRDKMGEKPLVLIFGSYT